MSRGLSVFVALWLGLAGAGLAQDADLVSAARTTLAGIQNNSFIANREYCGMIGRNAAGNIVITRPRKGRVGSCRPRNFWSNSVEVLASYHTHGSHDPRVDAEIPSFDDLRADQEEGVIGFVSTPGGRFWMTQPDRDRVQMICGPRCMPSDPSYNPADTGRIRTVYTSHQLLNRERGLDD